MKICRKKTRKAFLFIDEFRHNIAIKRIPFNMNYTINERTLIIADYVIKHHSTVRDTALVFGIAKSTIHKDLTKRLPTLSPSKFKEVRNILDINYKEKHIRGGESTRKMYLNKKNEEKNKVG